MAEWLLKRVSPCAECCFLKAEKNGEPCGSCLDRIEYALTGGRRSDHVFMRDRPSFPTAYKTFDYHAGRIFDCAYPGCPEKVYRGYCHRHGALVSLRRTRYPDRPELWHLRPLAPGERIEQVYYEEMKGDVNGNKPCAGTLSENEQ